MNFQYHASLTNLFHAWLSCTLECSWLTLECTSHVLRVLVSALILQHSCGL